MNLINSCEDTRRQDKSNMKPKFFSQISDQQQSVAPAPSRAFLTHPALLLVADFSSFAFDLVRSIPTPRIAQLAQ